MLLTTKLFIPPEPGRLVPREGLHARLDEGGGSPLTLVSAPAGFGKTALVSEWIRARSLPAAWVSLDEGDNDPARFWTYLIEALRTVDEGIGTSALRLLQSPQVPPAETLATIVINDAAEPGERMILVLDDLHVITSELLHGGLTFLIENLPPNIRLIATTRSDPPWPLAGFRAGGRMTELRAADLRFTTEETHQFIQAAALSLSDEDVETLTVRTEGWVAGLQLAALSMQGREDSTAFIRDFGGSNRFVLDYLAEEVLSGQPPDVQQFLMRTSILGRLCGDLCDAVTGLDGGQAILESFVQDNLFTAPLDTERRWYRYHHLFADVLRSHLRKQDGAAVPDLHRRAARWLEQQGLTGEAVEHAMAAGDLDQAAILIERIAEASFQVSNQAAVLGWLGQLPEEAIQRRPKLALTRAWGRFVTGDWEGIPPALEAAALAVLGAPPSKQAAMQAQLNAVQAWASYQMGDLAECVSLAEGALADLPPDGLAPPRVARAALGCALVQLGETGAARTTLADAIVESQRTGDAVMECLTLALAARADLVDGDLSQAARGCERAIGAGMVAGEPLPSVGIAQVQLGEVFRERNDLAGAERMLRAGIAVCGEALGQPELVFEGNVTLARVLTDAGDHEGAREAADLAEGILATEILPMGMEPIAGRALEDRLRLWLEQGEADRAARWLDERGVSAASLVDAPQPILHALLARTLLAQGEPQEALRLAEGVLDAAKDDAPLALVMELNVVRALARHRDGRTAEAVDLLAGAVRSSATDGWVRVFLDGGAGMLELLEALAARPDRPAAALALQEASRMRGQGAVVGPTPTHASDPLVEALNERELSCLQLFAAGRSNQEVADHLYLSVNTVKWHARNLYGKLGVSRRTMAVSRAREIGIL